MTLRTVNAFHSCPVPRLLVGNLLIAACVSATQVPAQNASMQDNGERVQVPENGERVQVPENGERVRVHESGERVQAPENGERVWVPDNGNGTYTNPVIHADYSDPDVIRVGDDFYMTSSSFSQLPGLPILHSRDLVNWRIIGHALPSHPSPDFMLPQRGNGIWAPAIRYHDGEFRIYVGDPDRGIFMTKAKDPAGPWGPLMLLRKVTGWIDPCPFWDDDGSAYLVHAYANSRVGVKSILVMNRMNREGTEILDDGIVVFVGHRNHPTIEGPKLYKRNGYYYIFAPAGGVKPGWQTVLRSRDIFGPYEDRIVLEQGSTRVNGPHQGAWVDTPGGEEWFVHFQDRYAYGRLVHLQPMRWENDWPLIGVDYDKNGIGEPVDTHRKPAVHLAGAGPVHEPQTNDEFDASALSMQWQWEANPRSEWYSLEAMKGRLRLFAQPQRPGIRNLWQTPSLLLQKFPAPAFTATTAVSLTAREAGERVGLVIFGLDYAYIALEKTTDGFAITEGICKKADKGTEENIVASAAVKLTDAVRPPDAGQSPDVIGSPDRAISPGAVQSPDAVSLPGTFTSSVVLLRVTVRPANPSDVIPTVLCAFQYSVDGTTFRSIGKEFTAREGHWVGAKVGLFVAAGSGQSGTPGSQDVLLPESHSPGGKSLHGFADVDWFRFGRVTQEK